MLTKETCKILVDEYFVGEYLTESFSRFLAPPCSINYMNGIHPICPEGPRFCGIKYWKEFYL